MSHAELLTLFDEIVAILETAGSPAEKLAHIEALIFAPQELDDEGDADLELDDES